MPITCKMPGQLLKIKIDQIKWSLWKHMDSFNMLYICMILLPLIQRRFICFNKINFGPLLGLILAQFVAQGRHWQAESLWSKVAIRRALCWDLS